MNPKQLKIVRQAKLDEMFSRLGRDEPLNDDERTALLWLIFDESLLQRGIQALQRETRGTGAMESSMERILGILEKRYRVKMYEQGDNPDDHTITVTASPETCKTLTEQYLGACPFDDEDDDDDLN